MKKNNLFYFLLVLILFFGINFITYISIYVITDKNLYTKEYKEFKKRFRKSEFKTIYPHPFFGFGVKNNYSNIDSFINEPLFVNDIKKKDYSQKIKILILGGSVAKHLSQNNSDDNINFRNILIDEKNIFQKTINEYFNSNKFIVYNAAIDGGKQPQQLFKLYYLDLLNFSFDIVINLDGFNELALSLSENYELNDHLIYPRNYSRLISTFNSNFDCVKNLNKKVKRFLYLPVLEFYDLFFIRKCHFKLEGQNKNSGTRFSEMTDFKKMNFEDAYLISKKIWKNSSEKINEFLSKKNIFYIHAIQPNFYLENSKLLTKNELSLTNYGKYGNIIKKYYRDFNVNDVDVENKIDLKFLFKNNNDDLYRDYCCHLNNKGMHLISLKIIKNYEDVLRSYLK